MPNEWPDQVVSSSEAAEMNGPGELPGSGSVERWQNRGKDTNQGQGLFGGAIGLEVRASAVGYQTAKGLGATCQGREGMRVRQGLDSTLWRGKKLLKRSVKRQVTSGSGVAEWEKGSGPQVK